MMYKHYEYSNPYYYYPNHSYASPTGHRVVELIHPGNLSSGDCAAAQPPHCLPAPNCIHCIAEMTIAMFGKEYKFYSAYTKMA